MRLLSSPHRLPLTQLPEDKAGYVAEPSVRPLRVSVENLSIRSEAGHVENRRGRRQRTRQAVRWFTGQDPQLRAGRPG